MSCTQPFSIAEEEELTSVLQTHFDQATLLRIRQLANDSNFVEFLKIEIKLQVNSQKKIASLDSAQKVLYADSMRMFGQDRSFIAKQLGISDQQLDSLALALAKSFQGFNPIISDLQQSDKDKIILAASDEVITRGSIPESDSLYGGAEEAVGNNNCMRKYRNDVLAAVSMYGVGMLACPASGPLLPVCYAVNLTLFYANMDNANIALEECQEMSRQRRQN